MRTWLMIAALVASFFGMVSQGLAEEPQLTEEELKALRKILRDRGGREEIPDLPVSEEDARRLETLAEPRTPEKKYGSGMQGSGLLVYARPFVSRPKAILGGYVDLEYTTRSNQGDPSFFDQHRLVPFIYGDVSDHVKFAAELEFEHGEEIGIEFAAIDYLINEPVNLRAGLLLLPLGKFNLLHDPPMRDLTERPIVDRRIIPSTLRQPGVGLHGSFYPSRLSQLDYEVYLTSGFTNAFNGGGPGVNDLDTSNITNTNGIRSARSSNTKFDNNGGKAWVGRVAFSPILGVEVGGSGFFGSYDPQSKRPLAIWALDWTFQHGPFELIGESAWAYIKDNHLNADGVTLNGNPRRMAGYYLQGNYHFLPQWLTHLAPSHFRQDISTFTAVVRWEEVNLGQDIDHLGTEASKRGRRQRLTLGLNFRPTEDTVMKLDFQYSPEEIDNNGSRIHDRAFLASWATYF